MINNLRSRVIQIFRKHSLPRWMVLLIDITTVFVSFLIAYLLRFNLELNAFRKELAFKQALIVLAVYTTFILLFKSYAGLIRQTTVRDTFKIFLTNTVSLIVVFLMTVMSRHYAWPTLFNIPLSIILIHFVIVTVILFFLRVFIKMFYEFASVSNQERRNTIIYGSGEMGMIVKKVISDDPRSGLRLKAFIDDDKKLQGKKIDGFPVLSRNILANGFIQKEGIKVFIFAINNIDAERKKEVLESVLGMGLEILETPSFDTWLDGRFQVRQLKKVKFEDLLGRAPIKLNLGRISSGLAGKRILITGAAGSIGSEIVRQLTAFKTGRLILVDQAETPVYFLESELKEKYPDCECKILVGDITRKEKMEFIFSKYRPDIVFHAAAYKHVPVMESQPHEAFRVNVGGTMILTDLAIKYGVEKFVYVSTDKAVNPTNVMGATKKLCELLVQAQSNRPGIVTQFVTTRFGNVLGSNGSVIPLFKKQIEQGGPVTVTDPGITRYFMTIPEACQLVLEAGFMGNGGEIYVFDMGAPVRIIDVANQLIRLSGFEPGEDIMIEYTGLRPGEKLYEELFSQNEPLKPTHHPKINIAQVAPAGYSGIRKKTEQILKDMNIMSGRELIMAMQEMVPEYKSKYEGNGGL